MQRKDIKTLPADVFVFIDALSAPRLVEYWGAGPVRRRRAALPDGAMKGGGVRRRRAGRNRRRRQPASRWRRALPSVNTRSSSSRRATRTAETWLHENKYQIPSGAKDALAPYIREQMKFFVAKVNIDKVHKDEHGVVVLSPLRFGFDSDELRLPVRLGLLNANGKQDLIVYITLSREALRGGPLSHRRHSHATWRSPTRCARRSRRSTPELFDATLAHANGEAVVSSTRRRPHSVRSLPTPPLQPSDLARRPGADIAMQQNRPTAITDQRRATLPRQPSASWVLTRLHTRYDKATLSEDLIFREGQPMVGGRANWDGTSGDAGAQPSGENNFQGRYIIRHYWTGAVKCDQPGQFGLWGQPPDAASPPPTAARGVAPDGGAR